MLVMIVSRMRVCSLTCATLRPARCRAAARNSPMGITPPPGRTAPPIPDSARGRLNSPVPAFLSSTSINAPDEITADLGVLELRGCHFRATLLGNYPEPLFNIAWFDLWV
jgi:hypothetical protein